MILAVKDIRHNLVASAYLCWLEPSVAIVLAMVGIYRGLIEEALGLARSAQADVWVVEVRTRGPFAEASRLPADSREAIAAQWGVAAAGSVSYQNLEVNHRGQIKRVLVVGAEIGRLGEAPAIIEGRAILRSRYEAVADRSAGFAPGRTGQARARHL